MGMTCVVEDGDQPADGADEALLRACASTCSWASRGWRFLWEAFGEDFGRGRPLRVTVAARYSPLGVLTFSSFRNLHADFLGKGMRGWSGLTVLVCDLAGRASNLFGDVGLGGRNSRSENREAAGCIETGNRAGWRQALALEERAQAIPQFTGGAVDHARRDFFAADFEQKVRHSYDYSMVSNYKLANVSGVT